MVTRKAAVFQLLNQAAERIGGANWSVAGGNRLRARLDSDTEAIILPLAAGHVTYTVSVNVGPRFSAVERIVAKASRAAGQPEAGIRTAAVFPTVFERLAKLSSVPDHSSLLETEVIVEALRDYAIPYIRKLSTAGAAADYALANPVAYGSHALRIPVLLAKAGRRGEAREYFDQQISARTLYSEFLTRYREAVMPLL